ncbi:lysM domain receptor-like kinase 4 [Cornus florida]|uniref:lysM domain receptor-like kinase 4 n=1 Tax=Cornus florida TaxID=4283 RepID=UPI0028A0C69E|nr:lysM domain receptor-like kinase 4 [Cornus florida]
MDQFLLSFFIFFSFSTSYLNAQQMYSANSVMDCNNTDETGPSPAFLYSCNGKKKSCPAFLIFRSQSPYNSVTTISNLTSSDPLELAHINDVPILTLFPPDKEVIVPVNCSCSGQYYQANTSYLIQSLYDTYFTLANYTYQGLTTCDSLMPENAYGEYDLVPGLKLQVPLRCACATSNQIANGTKFLLSYLVTWHDSIPKLSERFNVSARSVAYANGFSEEDPMLYPFTTILIPLPTEPLSSQTIVPNPPVVDPPISPNRTPNRRSRKWKKLYSGIGIGTGISLMVIGFILLVVFLHRKRSMTRKHEEGKNKWILPEELLARIGRVDKGFEVYEFKELEAATEKFSPQNRLSDSVYRGVLRGKVVATKMMSVDVSKEVNILTKINHFNLISLYGACEFRGIFYLIYEFMEIGSLKGWLHQKSSYGIQSWNYRIQIALDVANGLHYLHDFADPPYVHKDINSGNILLNRDLRAKVANFGLARSAKPGGNTNSTTVFVPGTKGYMAPEYREARRVTPKIDTYAFGVILLELITGREAIFKHNGEDELLSEAVLSIMDGGNAEAKLGYLIDPRLQVRHPLGYVIDQTELALRIVKLSVGCLAQEPASRLSMTKVVSTLMKIQLDVQKSEYFSLEY